MKMSAAMRRSGPRAGHDQPVSGAGDPAVHHHLSYFRVKLQSKSLAMAKSLMREKITLGQQNACLRDGESLPVPLINMIRPIQNF